ncbi:iron-binding protein [Tulasnella sp. 418]|nr:iron-binding protein [Tulasnella sp. 418]
MRNQEMLALFPKTISMLVQDLLAHQRECEILSNSSLNCLCGEFDKTHPYFYRCGDVMKLQIRVDENGIISDVKFKTFGCGSAIASSSYLTERVKGLSLEEAGKIKNTEIAKELCLPPVKLHCSMLAEDAIRSAIRDYRSKRTSVADAPSKTLFTTKPAASTSQPSA